MTAEDLRLLIFPLAVIGAALVLGASILQGKDSAGKRPRLVLMARAGYGLTFLSMGLFIVLGFMSDG